MSGKKHSRFNNRIKLCMITLFVFGNYFALIGLHHAERARRMYYESQTDMAAKEAEYAKRWALWGLIPSTIINATLIYMCVLFVIWLLSLAGGAAIEFR